jgi:hypothetical protein
MEPEFAVDQRQYVKTRHHTGVDEAVPDGVRELHSAVDAVELQPEKVAQSTWNGRKVGSTKSDVIKSYVTKPTRSMPSRSRMNGATTIAGSSPFTT